MNHDINFKKIAIILTILCWIIIAAIEMIPAI
jgi:hypothetical protein